MNHLLAVITIFISITCQGQEKHNILTYSHFEITLKRDTIDFIVADTNLLDVKPVLLFCQGSQPVPLFIDFGNQQIVPVPLSNFDANKMKEHYHVVVISMPHTPVIVTPENLNHSYNYVTDTSSEYSYKPEFIEADVLENYVDRANHVIKFLRKQKWVDKSKLVISGHSQGSRVAVGIANSNKHVTKVGLFSYNPMRRIDQLIWSYRKQAQNQEISWEEADSLQQTEYEFYSDILNDDSLSVNPELRSWRSFSTCSIHQLSQLDVPLYIAYGSLDNVAEYCDLLPFYFADHNKTNYVLKRYPNVEHNFFPVDENFRPDYNNGKWKEVMYAFIDWSIE